MGKLALALVLVREGLVRAFVRATQQAHFDVAPLCR